MAVSIIVTVLGVYGGFREVASDKVKMLQTFGAARLQILQKVIIPAAIPTIGSANRLLFQAAY
ncbi:hypothetical protein [Geosporobacter ferrireducens]|uniref:hypothetical protein n=1 Tax=Geosporobacter ferrireducens TaxID=1424294 RepID=UPI00139C3122|nr:hypothetical protein [Geosporobacter ferrireducens]MTI54791.1 ABC transporter permease subunit [Geosporobacter ferrireducens]